MQPKIAIGCPVRNRAWVLPEYLQALRDIDYEDKMFLFLENDSEDNTAKHLYNFQHFTNRDLSQMSVDVRVDHISTASPHWNHGDYAHEQYANLARVRNHFLDMFLRTNADFLLSVDSDVIVPPNIVTRLMRHMDGRTIAGAAISNVPDKPLDGYTPGNFMTSGKAVKLAWREDEQGNRVPYEISMSAYAHPFAYPTSGIHPVDLIGAVYLIPRAVIEAGARYAPHQTGEDAPFCEAARQLGYRLLVDMDVRCEHRMVKV